MNWWLETIIIWARGLQTDTCHSCSSEGNLFLVVDQIGLLLENLNIETLIENIDNFLNEEKKFDSVSIEGLGLLRLLRGTVRRAIRLFSGLFTEPYPAPLLKERVSERYGFDGLGYGKWKHFRHSKSTSQPCSRHTQKTSRIWGIKANPFSASHSRAR